jgi:2-dehydro-3-deoxygluconokinase
MRVDHNTEGIAPNRTISHPGGIAPNGTVGRPEGIAGYGTVGHPLPGVACYGEVLLRLTAPQHGTLLQHPSLEVNVGGAEANVAVSLTHFGHPAALVTVLPDNPLGHAALGEFRRHGVRTEAVQFRPGRMGLYFLTAGAGHRPSEVLYDRAESAFALAPPDLIDWDLALADYSWLHLSGITPAVSPPAAEAALRAVRAARARGVSVSFDCNYRAKLWERWHGSARTILGELVNEADLLFAEQRDIALILGHDYDQVPAEQRFRKAATEALEAFPRLQRIATTVRVQHNVDDHDLAAVIGSRAGLWTTRRYSLGQIVDRIGSGDAFAAGVLHALLRGCDDQAVADFGLAAACLKHSIPGDFNRVGVADVRHLLQDTGFTVRR